jgi:hypothetical protein
MALSFCDYNRYHDLMVFIQISNFKKCIFNHPKSGNNKIPFTLATFGDADMACHMATRLISSRSTS